MIVPGGGISLDGSRWISCRPNFFLPVRVLSRLFRRLFLEKVETETVEETRVLKLPCPCCGGQMVIIESFEAGCKPRYSPTPEAIDSS